MRAWTQIGRGLLLVALLLRWVTERPLRSLLRVLRIIVTWSWHSIIFLCFPFGTTVERLGEASLRELRVVSSSTWRVFREVSWLLDVSDLMREGEAFRLMRFLVWLQIIVDMVVVRWAWHDELLLELVRRSILLASSSPS